MAEKNEKLEEVAAAKEKKAEKKPNIFVRAASRVKKFFKDYSSELKKVVWLSKDEVRKNSAVVIVTVVVCAIAIGIVDLISSGAINLVARWI